MKKWILLFGLAAVMLLTFVCCGCTSGTVSESEGSGVTSDTNTPSHSVSSSGNPTTTSNNPSNTATEAKPTNIENGELGKTYTINYMNSKYEVTLTDTAFANSEYGSTKYLMAYFEIKNVGATSEYITPKIYALDSSQEKYDSTIAFGIADKYSKTLDFIKELPPNTKTSGWAAIEIQDDQLDYDLYFEYTNIYLSDTPNYIKYHITH